MTAFGELGELKQYDRIVLRVAPIGSFRANQLLHQASYNRYRKGLWAAGRSGFERLLPAEEKNENTWRLAQKPPGKSYSREITLKHAGENTVLSLPHGCYRIRGLKADRLERNQYGAFRIQAPANSAMPMHGPLRM